MSQFIPPIYRTKNWPEYNKALKDRGSLTIWFNPEVTWRAAPTGKRDRQPRYSDAAIQACLTLKVLFGMPLRQTTGFVESLLKLVDLDWEVPDFSTLCRRQKTLSVAIPYRGSAGPLHLLVDSTGIKAEGEGEWNARKHGGPKRRLWRKIHIGIDEETLEIWVLSVVPVVFGAPNAAFSQNPKASASIGTTRSPSAVTASLIGASGSRPQDLFTQDGCAGYSFQRRKQGLQDGLSGGGHGLSCMSECGVKRRFGFAVNLIEQPLRAVLVTVGKRLL
jgi:Transposase DDE domain